MKYKHLILIIGIILDICFFFVPNFVPNGKFNTLSFAFAFLCFASLIITSVLLLVSLIKFIFANWDEKIGK
jgi:hypothetical protein